MAPELNISRILRYLGIPRASYYYFARNKNFKEIKDKSCLELIGKVHRKRKGKLGIRQLKLQIARDYGVVINHKKIARIKNQYGLKTTIRKKRTQRQIQGAEHKIFENKLNRNFQASKKHEKILTDITQFNFGKKNNKAYLVAFKDLSNKMILSYKLSSSLSYEFVGSALSKLLDLVEEPKKLMIHSDQGGHFTCKAFINSLKEKGVEQSMSRRGNCHDNAPMESFFGLIKDHIDYKTCGNIYELQKQVDKAIYYYNYERPQIGLNKMPPAEYRRRIVS